MTVALEEHFATQEIMEAWKKVDPRWRDIALKASTKGGGAQRLLDLGSERLAAMDAAGIDVAVLSLTTPGAQNHSADLAVGLARDANDRLAAAVSRQPKRFQGFATLPTPSPLTAAKELERSVRELGLQGAMLHGRTRERNLSEEEFWPILDVADALRAPLYLHPQSPQHGVLDEVMLFYLDGIDMLSSPPICRARSPTICGKMFQLYQAAASASAISVGRLRYWARNACCSQPTTFARETTDEARTFFNNAQLRQEVETMIASKNWNNLCAAIRY